MKFRYKTKPFHFWLILTCGTLLVLQISNCRLKNDPPQNNTQKSAAEKPAPEPVQPIEKDWLLFEEPDLPLPEPEYSEVNRQEPEDLPKIAIIIDDMGYHEKIGDQLLALDLHLTFSFLAAAPFAQEQKRTALQKKRDILVHLPMEAQDPKWDPGPNALYLKNPLEDIAPTVKKNLNLIPEAIGVNNHMGSRYTENRPAIHEMLKVLKKRHLFFIDSYTSVNSVAMDEARKMGIKTARRHVFLDNIHNEENICRQLERLINLAQKQGWAIGIGHPNKETLLALTRCKTDLFKLVRLVDVHELVE